MTYLDYSATTPIRKEVLDIYNKVSLEYPGNSNSLHSLGVKSKELEDKCTKIISNLLKVKQNEIIYTSGASESNNTAIKGICFKYQNRGKHIITTYLEHSSIIAPLNYLSDLGFEVDFVNIKENGLVDVEHLKSLLRDDTILVSICAVDSEIGLVEPINEIANILKEYPKCFFHVDCTQALGKIDIDFTNIDLASMSAHKIFGPKGIGLLIKKENIVIEPLIHGGKSTTPYRSGTPPLPLIAGLTKALELSIPNVDKNYDYIKKLSDKVKEKLSTYKIVHINSTSNSIPHTINFSLKNIKPETFIHALEEKEIYISTKSACSKSDSISKSVLALTNDYELSNTTLRISISCMTTESEIDYFLSAFDECINKLNL
ncbi:MAG: cysteine desulfurase [Tenericutes bacterium]|nr:cysteine desulfurase [Mycoplasmatota bacterium]